MESRRAQTLLLLALAALVIIAKVPTLGVGAYWDEVRWVQQANWLAERSLIEALPGFRPPAAFFGHPPGLHATIAAIWKVTGASLPVAHLLIACFAAVGVCATYLLARLLYGALTALVAALLLVLSPLFLAQAGMFLGDVPVMALGVLSVYLALRDRLIPYVICASYMVLLKETAIALLVALIAYRFLRARYLTRASVADALKYSIPLFVIGAFFVLQKITTGKFFFIYDTDIQLFELTPERVKSNVKSITAWLFLRQGRWILTLAILVNLVATPAARRRSELWLFAMITVLAGFSFSVLYYLPRYLLPVLPFFYILGAAALMDLARTGSKQVAVGLAAIGFMTWSLAVQPFFGNGETNLTYLRVVRTHHAMARELTESHPGARVLTTSRPMTELRDPVYGYVTTPLTVDWYGSAEKIERSDVILVLKPEAREGWLELRELARQRGWRLARRLEDGAIEAELYVRPGWPPLR